ncbi:MAG: DUF1552 domain-containing protein [Verrucomicrobiales bacterium]|nr:DUF1552 domain-containing protein [Verrucomicrobiales bacterium]
MSSSISKRHFLRSSTALVALPFMESMGFRRFAKAAPVAKAPKRMAFLGVGFGFSQKSWYPDINETGENWKISQGLSPLERHQKDLTVIQNLYHQYSNEAHWGSTMWLTGANRYAVPGQSFHNTISVDQAAAEQLGRDTRFTSIQLSTKGNADGHGPGLSLAWNRQGKPVSALDNPLAAFHRLFSDSTVPLAQRQADLKKQRSLLDTVLEDAKSTRGKLTQTDKDKLDEYFQSIRDIEIRISKEEEWLDVPKPKPDASLTQPAKGVNGVAEIEIMYDLMVAAMQVDATRVLTYRQPLNSVLQSMGASITAHNMSHYADGDRKVLSEERDQKQSEMLARFIDKLKATPDVDGSRLFDNVTLTMGSNIHSIHYLTNCPTVVTGGGSGIQHGRHLVMPEKTPLCNLWLSLLNGSGIKADSHGDSTGQIGELFG